MGQNLLFRNALNGWRVNGWIKGCPEWSMGIQGVVFIFEPSLRWPLWRRKSAWWLSQEVDMLLAQTSFVQMWWDGNNKTTLPFQSPMPRNQLTSFPIGLVSSFLHPQPPVMWGASPECICKWYPLLLGLLTFIT